MLPLNKMIHVDSYMELMKDMSYKQALESIRERRFLKKDLGISYRELNHWSVNGLLFEENEVGKWRKFNAIELIWIEILKELRYYNLPLMVLKIIKETVSLPVPYFNLVQEIGIDVFEDLLKRQFSEEQYNIIINSEAHKQLRKTKQINGLESLMPDNLFEFFFLEAYFLKFQYKILLNYNGQMTFYSELYRDEIINSNYYKEHLEKSYLSISINELISKVFNDYSIRDLKAHWRLINENEVDLLNLIQSEKQLKSINIRFNNQSKIDLLEVKEEINVSINQYLKNLLVAGNYEEIRIVTQKGQIAVCEKTTKRKI